MSSSPDLNTLRHDVGGQPSYDNSTLSFPRSSLFAPLQDQETYPHPDEALQALDLDAPGQPRGVSSIEVVVPILDCVDDYKTLAGHSVVRRILRQESHDPNHETYSILHRSGERQIVRRNC